MTRRWPWIVLALVAITAGVFAYAAANLNGYLTNNRAALAERASAALGRKVSFENVELSFSRGLGVALADLAIADDPRFAAGDFLRTDRAVVRVRVLPALFGRYEIASIVLDAPDLTVVRTSEGLNISTLGGKADEPAGADDGAPGGSAVVVALVDVNDGKLKFVDKTATPAREMVVEAVDLSASDFSAGKSLRFELGAAIFGASEPNLKASGAVGPFDATNTDATALDVVLQLDDADMRALVAALAPSAGLRASGPLRAKVHAGGSLGAPSVDFNVDAGEADLAYASSFAKPAQLPFAGVGKVALADAGALVLEDVTLTVGAAVLEIGGTLKPAKDSYANALDVSGTSVALAALGKVLPALASEAVRGMADVDLDLKGATLGAPDSIVGRIALDGLEVGESSEVPLVSQLHTVLAFEGRSVSMQRTELRVAGTPATLEASCPDIYAPRVHFTMTARSLSLADLGVSGAAEGDELASVRAAGRLVSTERSVDVDADLRAERGMLAGVAMTNIVANLKRRDGRFELSPFSLDASDGKLTGTATYAPGTDSAPSRFRFDGKLAEMSIARVAISLTGVPSPVIDGKVNLAVNAEGTGDDWDAMRRSLDGNGKLDVLDGALRGVNLAESALTGVTGLPGLSSLLPQGLRSDFPALFGTKDTQFDAMSAALEIAAGKLLAKDLSMIARDFAIRGGGAIGLDGTVDVGAMLAPSVALSRRLIEEASVIKHLAGADGRIVVPFRLAGKLPAARPAPDLGALTAALQRNLLDDLGERVFGNDKKPDLDPKPKPPREPTAEAVPPAGALPETPKKKPAAEQPRAPETPPADAAKPARPKKPARAKKPAGDQAPPSEPKKNNGASAPVPVPAPAPAP